MFGTPSGHSNFNPNPSSTSNLKSKIQSLEIKIKKIEIENKNLKYELIKNKSDLEPTRETSQITIEEKKQKDQLQDSFASFANFNTDNSFNNLSKNFQFIKLFKGSIINGQKNGYCEEEFANGTLYMGNYVKGKRQGTGYLKTKRFEYKGNFENDKFDDFGEKHYFEQKIKLIGKFKNDQFNGDTLQIRGMTYKGGIINDQMHGQGSLEIKERFKFFGLFINNKIFIGQTQAKLVDNENNETYIVSVQLGEKENEVLLTAKNNLIFAFDQVKGSSMKGPYFRNMSAKIF